MEEICKAASWTAISFEYTRLDLPKVAGANYATISYYNLLIYTLMKKLLCCISSCLLP